MNVPFTCRGQSERLPGGSWIAQAIQTAITAITATWDVQHTDDGAHGVITLASTTGPSIRAGSGSPEGLITAPVGSLYLRTDGSTSTTLYVKTAGTAATGWTPK